MKKEDNTKLTVDEILEEIENAGLNNGILCLRHTADKAFSSSSV